MFARPKSATPAHELASGLVALPPGLLWIAATRTLVAADVHFGYEDVVGSSLPLWSTTALVSTLEIVAASMQAREIVLLGDVIHGSRMSEGAARAVAEGLAHLRGLHEVVPIAGNHEGRSRGASILGPTLESCERGGWLLVHGDRPRVGPRTIVGHLHPSIHLGGGRSAPAFLAGAQLVVVPALTPYSPGLDVLAQSCTDALAPWGVTPRDIAVCAATDEAIYPFGTLARLRAALHADAPPAPVSASRYRRRILRGDRN